LNIRLNIKSFFFFSLVSLSSYALAFSIVGLNPKGEEQKKIPHFHLNGSGVISQNGESITSKDIYSLALVNLSIDDKEPLELMNNYYEIQEILLMKDLHIKKLEHKKFGQLKIQTTNNEFIKFQDFQLSDQLRTLKLFFQSKDSQNLLKNFKTIDLRHKNKLAIGYY
tara:strand:+ start:160 stop:660 length:501 start_codon:yes stop_codon:yes gene_type:complete